MKVGGVDVSHNVALLFIVKLFISKYMYTYNNRCVLMEFGNLPLSGENVPNCYFYICTVSVYIVTCTVWHV